MSDDRDNGRSRWKFLIPNAVTATNMMLGAAALMVIVAGYYEVGGWLILLGVLLDKVDGTTARMLGASSAFGVEFDSLADLVTFGVAPATLVFSVVGGHIPFIHRWALVALAVACGAYVLASAVRLARFNLDAQSGGYGVYFGIPMPLGASALVTVLLVAMKYSGDEIYHTWALDPRLFAGFVVPQWAYEYFFLLVFVVAGGLVSSLRVPKPKWDRDRMPITLYVLANAVVVYVLIPLQAMPELLIFAAYQWLVVSAGFTFLSRGKILQRPSFMETISRPPAR